MEDSVAEEVEESNKQDCGNKKATIQIVTLEHIGDDKEEDKEHPSGAIPD